MFLAPPAIDRHVHLEGSLDPIWVRNQADKAGRAIPAALEILWKREQVPFEGFIDAFFFCCSFLRNSEAIRETLHTAARRVESKVASTHKGLDIWLSPHYLCKQENFLSLDELWKGMDTGIQELRSQGIKIAVIIDAVNHFGIKHGHEVLDMVLGNRPDWIVGFSTGGLEGVPFREWRVVFDRARKAGLRLAAHAGENGPAANVKEAILEAGVSRIVHGVRAAEHPEILELLVDKKIPVDICISSNHALVPNLGKHPLPKFLRHGVRCGLGLDDPGVIPCNMEMEWKNAEDLGLNPEEMNKLRNYSIEDAWCMNA